MDQQQSIEYVSEIGDYRVHKNKILGAGKFGTVTTGYHKQKPEKILAIKQMPYTGYKGGDSNGANAKNLNREISIMKKLKSPYIVRFYTFKKSSNNIYIVMEKCNQGSLAKYIALNGGKLSIGQCCTFFQQLTEGFKVLYNESIIHRDIKPDNILMHDGICKISDFGLGKILTDYEYEETKTHTLCGSPHYMAPQLLQQYVQQTTQTLQPGEQLHYNPKCDVWSMGMVFYQMLIGKKPFSKDEMHANIITWLNNIYTIPLEFPENTPPLMKDLISNMLVIDENDRYGWREVFEHKLFTDLEQQQKLKESKQFLELSEGQDIANTTKDTSDFQRLYLSQPQQSNNNQQQYVNGNNNNVANKISPIHIQYHAIQFNFNLLIQVQNEYSMGRFKISSETFSKFMLIALKLCIMSASKLELDMNQIFNNIQQQQQQIIQQQQQQSNNQQLIQELEQKKMLIQSSLEEIDMQFQKIKKIKSVQITYFQDLVNKINEDFKRQQQTQNNQILMDKDFLSKYVNLNFDYDFTFHQEMQNTYQVLVDMIVQQQRPDLLAQQMNQQYDQERIKFLVLFIQTKKLSELFQKEFSIQQINNFETSIYYFFQKKLDQWDIKQLLQVIFN